MRKQLLLILVGTLLASQVARAREPAAVRKTASSKASTTKKKSDAPRLFRDTIIMAQAIVPPPAPAADGPTPVPGAVISDSPPPPAIQPVPQSMPMESMPMTSAPMASDAVQLYDCVKYKDLDNIHPCAVTKIVAVVDPCQNPCDTCGPRCVYVQICVPPCDCAEVKTSHNGRKVKYKYGKYQVEIESKKSGVVEVDYDHHLLHF